MKCRWILAILLAVLAVQPVFALENGMIEAYQQRIKTRPQAQPITWENVYTYDLTKPSDLSGLVMEGALAGLEDDILEAQELGVNGLFLLAVIKHESANGNSGLAQDSHNLGESPTAKAGTAGLPAIRNAWLTWPNCWRPGTSRRTGSITMARRCAG